MLSGITKYLRRVFGSRTREEAVCYHYNDSLFLCAVNEVRNGPGVEWEPYLRMSFSDSDSSIGAALLQILDNSGRILDLKNADELREARKEQLRAAGFSSERKLQMSAVLCVVRRAPDSIQFTPTKNGGTRGDTKGFVPLENAISKVPSAASHEELGAALRDALRRCVGTTDAPAA